MIKLKKHTYLIALGLLIVFSTFSCVKDIDTDQVDDLVLRPVIATSLLRLEIPDTNFNNIPTPVRISDSLEYEGFRTGFVPEKLIRADLIMRFVNSTAKSFETSIQFIDGNNVILDSHPFTIPGANNREAVTVSRTITYEGDQLDIVRNTEKIKLIAETNDLPTSFLADPKLEFNLSGKLYLEIE